MPHILLLGAGFSRNWGGLVASEMFNGLLAQPAIQNDQTLRMTLWINQGGGGFENALADIQRAYTQNAGENQQRLQAMQTAILNVFHDMNQAFVAMPGIEFQQFQARMLRTFLVRFDAIFTLNQDILLDHHYLNDNIALAANQRWPNGAQLPGMRRLANQQAFPPESWGTATWVPLEPAEFRIEDNAQPFFKIHGSTNWRDAQGGQLLVMGGDKARHLQSSQILAWYYERFREYLNRPNTRLMVIGYGFKDPHINQLIVHAVANGLRLFVIDSHGADVVRRANPSFGGAIYAPNELDEAFHIGLIGASQRPLSETFGDGAVSHAQVMHFFD